MILPFAAVLVLAADAGAGILEPLVARTYDVAVGEKVAVTASEVGLVTWTPDGARRLGVLALPGSGLRVVLAGDVAWVALGPDGLAAVSVADPASPRELSRLATTASVLGVAVEGSTAYVAEGDAGLAVIDVADPAAPKRVGRLLVGAHCRAVAVRGGTALVAASHAGAIAVDVRDPKSPRRLGLLQLPGPAQDAAFVSDGLALVAAGPRGAFLVGLENPASPLARGTIPSADFARGVAARGTDVAVADGGGGVALVSIADPDAPKLVRRAPTKGQAVRVAFRADGKPLAAADGSGLVLVE